MHASNETNTQTSWWATASSANGSPSNRFTVQKIECAVCVKDTCLVSRVKVQSYTFFGVRSKMKFTVSTKNKSPQKVDRETPVHRTKDDFFVNIHLLPGNKQMAVSITFLKSVLFTHLTESLLITLFPPCPTNGLWAKRFCRYA